MRVLDRLLCLCTKQNIHEISNCGLYWNWNLPKRKFLNEQNASLLPSRTETWIPVFPKWTPLHKELGGCDFELLHDLCFESNTILKQETQEKRQSEKQNVLLSWKDKERIFILHTTGSIGPSLNVLFISIWF